MTPFITILGYTFREHVRHRLFWSLFLFSFILLGGGLVIASLAMAERARLFFDLGLSGIEFLGLTSIVFVSVNLVLHEIDTRTIYFVLSRPVSRSLYIVGRFTGTLLAVGLSIALMGLLHAALLSFYGSEITPRLYAMAWACAWAKLCLVGSLALALSLFSTSAPTAMTFTLFLWAMGHFSEELRFLGEKSAQPFLKAMVALFYHLAPNFSYFNFRDFLYAPHPPTAPWFAGLCLYTAGYTAACLWISAFLFSRKEF